jgi:hypothetical protein
MSRGRKILLIVAGLAMALAANANIVFAGWKSP